jgi:LysR family transcriptional regulator, cyn operon transcriptional activator
MELNHLRYFFEVAKAGSFTKASRNMRVSQSAISKIVALLEDRENTQLLHRSKSGVSLTPIGAEVFQICERIFADVTSIQNLCRGFQETCEGTLRIGASDHIANYLIAPKALVMRSKYPKLLTSVFSGTPNDIVELILKNDLELGLFFSKVSTPGLQYEVVEETEMVFVCRPELLPVRKSIPPPEKLREAVNRSGFIGSIKRHYSRHPSQTLFKLMGKDPALALESSSQETQKRFCLQGGGFAFLARFMVEEEIRKKKLVVIPMKPMPFESLFLVRKKEAPLSFNAKTFLKEMGWL